MKSDWLTVHRGRSGRVRFKGTNKRLAAGQELNALVVNTIKYFLKANRRVKDTTAHNSVSEEDQENFNFKNLSIGE